jgi:hypothetical protein
MLREGFGKSDSAIILSCMFITLVLVQTNVQMICCLFIWAHLSPYKWLMRTLPNGFVCSFGGCCLVFIFSCRLFRGLYWRVCGGLLTLLSLWGCPFCLVVGWHALSYDDVFVDSYVAVLVVIDGIVRSCYVGRLRH